MNMKINQIFIICCAVLFVVATGIELEKQEPIHKLIKQTYSNLQREQAKHDQEFKKFPTQFAKQKGLYSSDIKLNFMDSSNSFFAHLLRESFSVYDNNMFVTNFVILGLLEASDLGQVQLDNKSIDEALDALLTFKDKNQKNNTTPVYNFWQQINVNGTWQSYPINLENVVDIYNSLPPFIQKLSSLFGISPSELKQMVSSFVIPPDNDDSGINIALGSFLRSHKEKFPSLYSKWESQNNDYEGFYSIVKKYAYRPLSQQFQSNFSTNASDIIDPRTYFYLHQFIQQNSEFPITLFSTWLINQNDEKSNVVKQPFHTNNVDLTVNANSLFGLNSLLTTLSKEEAENLFSNDLDLKGLHRNVTNLLAYGIQSGIVLSRPDLALTYYPSEYDFYWFVARNVHLLRTAKQNNKLFFDELEYCLSTLEDSLLNIGIQQLIDQSQTDDQGNVFWEGFLGNYANKSYHEDRLFSTAVTLNTLLDAYTFTSADLTKRVYISNTPDQVKKIIQKTINFILSVSENQKTPKMNTFFSGSVKGFQSLPFFYPSNYGLYLNNGTYINPSAAQMNNISDDLIVAFKGSVSEQEYEQYLNQKWFGMSTPQNFTGFNEPQNAFPFWSSKSITDVFVIQALSKFQTLI
ncbi:hypothetical protein ABPG74_011484 [Tetrahymena malaccensis]